MHPVLIDFAGVTIGSYSVMLALAILVSVVLAVHEAERRGSPITYPLALVVLAGGLVGARAFWILQFSEPSELWRAFFVWAPGLVFYGGLLGGIVTFFVCLRVKRGPNLETCDAVAPYIALGEGIARIGCFLAGCCWGRPCTLPWGVSFPAGSFASEAQADAGLLRSVIAPSLPVHPTQLYMVVGLLLTAVLLKGILHRKRRHGVVLLSYLLCYGILRFTVEVFRGDSARPLMGMTASQVISLVLAAVAGAGLAVLWKRASDQPDTD